MITAWLWLGAAIVVAAAAGIAAWRWRRREQRPLIDPYPGGDALREYVRSEYEHEPAHEGDQPKPDK